MCEVSWRKNRDDVNIRCIKNKAELTRCLEDVIKCAVSVYVWDPDQNCSLCDDDLLLLQTFAGMLECTKVN